MGLGLIVLIVFATIGQRGFGERAPGYFGTFSRSLLTMFKMVAFGRWPWDELPWFKDDNIDTRMDVGVVLYVFLFVAIVLWVLL